MSKPGFVIGPFTVDTGTGSGTTNTDFPVIDLSWCKSIRATLSCTKAAEDVADTLDVYIQSLAHDGLTYNDRIHFAQITGDMSPSATAPETRIANLLADGPLEASEESYEASGSAGGARLPVGTVRNGPFPSKLRGATGWIPNWRVSVVRVDADADADWECNLYLVCR